MTPLSPDHPDHIALSAAASLFESVGRNAPDELDETAILSLQATELLVRAGALVVPRPGDLTVTDVRQHLVDGLRALGAVSEPTHQSDPVADASDAAQRALATTAGH